MKNSKDKQTKILFPGDAVQLELDFSKKEYSNDFVVQLHEDNDDFDILMAADKFKERGCINKNFSQFKTKHYA